MPLTRPEVSEILAVFIPGVKVSPMCRRMIVAHTEDVVIVSILDTFFDRSLTGIAPILAVCREQEYSDHDCDRKNEQKQNTFHEAS